MPIKRTHKPSRKTKRAIKSNPIRVEWPDIAGIVEQAHFEHRHRSDPVDLPDGFLESNKYFRLYLVYVMFGLMALTAIATIVFSLFPHLLF